MKVMEACTTNSAEIGHFQKSEEDGASLMDATYRSVGGSLLPALSLLNNSCDPNTFKVFCNDTIVVIANRIIEEGEEVTHNYSYVYAEVSRETRFEYLKRKYCFDCHCQACDQDWPTKESIAKNFDDLQDGQLLVDIGDGKALMQQVTKIHKLGSTISQEQRAGNYKKAFGFCIEFIKVLEETIKRPHAYYLMAEKSLFKLAWIMYGSTTA